MPTVKRLDHVGLTVENLEEAIAFFKLLGLEVQGRMDGFEGDFLDTVCGIPNSKTSIVMLGIPGSDVGVELSSFERPAGGVLNGDPMANDPGLRSLAFEVEDLETLLEVLREHGYLLVGGVGEYEGVWKMAYVRGPEGIIVALAQRLTGQNR